MSSKILDKYREILEIADETSTAQLSEAILTLQSLGMRVPDEFYVALTDSLNRERSGAGTWQAVRNGRKTRLILRLNK